MSRDSRVHSRHIRLWTWLSSVRTALRFIWNHRKHASLSLRVCFMWRGTKRKNSFSVYTHCVVVVVKSKDFYLKNVWIKCHVVHSCKFHWVLNYFFYCKKSFSCVVLMGWTVVCYVDVLDCVFCVFLPDFTYSYLYREINFKWISIFPKQDTDILIIIAQIITTKGLYMEKSILY